MAANYDRINLTVSKGQRDIIKAHAAARSESVNGFINRAIAETMERDGHKGPSEAAGAALEAGVALPSEADKTAQKATREALPHIRNDEASKGGQ